MLYSNDFALAPRVLIFLWYLWGVGSACSKQSAYFFHEKQQNVVKKSFNTYLKRNDIKNCKSKKCTVNIHIIMVGRVL